MHHRNAFAAACLLLCAAGAQGAPPLETYGRLPTLESFTLSPNGKLLAYATDVEGKRTVLISALDQGKVVAGITVGDQKLRDLTWADDDNLLLTMSVTHSALGAVGPRQEYFLTQDYRLSDHKSMLLLKHGTDAMNIVLRYPEVRRDRGRASVFLTGITFNSGKGVVTLFQADLKTGDTSVVDYGTRLAHDWLIDGDGAIVGRTTYDEMHQIWGLQVANGIAYKTVAQVVAPIDSPWVQGISPDGGSLIVVMPEKGDFVEKSVTMANGAWSAAPAIPPGATPVFDPATHRIIGMSGLGETSEYHFFTKADQDAWDGLIKAFPGEIVELQSWSDDRKQVVVKVDGKRDGSSYFLIDRNTHQASFLGSAYAGIEPNDIAEVRRISYKAADGMEIPAYLTLPIGKDPKKLPLIVLAHGGPADRDTQQFDWWAQALASRGYAVLQPQFRGSDGFGWDHLAAGFGQWGRKMQTDLSDGVRFLAAQGTIDAGRVCVVGGSYGGYAALAGAAIDRGVYRCAVSDAGISDLGEMLAWEDDHSGGDDNRSLRYWDRYMGASDAKDPRLAEVSPLTHVGAIAIPVLLIHGKDDTVVPIEQSEMMEKAMKAAGKPVTFVKLDGEDHWLSRAQTRLQMLQAMVTFLEANNPPN